MRWSIIVFIFAFYTTVFSQGTIKGKVVDKSTGEPLPSADVHLVEIKRGTITKTDGTFVIQNVPTGNYTIEVSYVGYKKSRKKVEVKDGLTLDVEIELEQTVLSLPDVVVTGTMYERSPFEIHQPIAVLDEDKLGLRLSENLAKTLSYEPGINLEYNGSAVGRPVIRGLSGTRILILDNGSRIGDASDLTPDHAVSFDPASVERVEIIRGPASLFYGVNALGGAINVISNDIPRAVHDKLRGSLRLTGESVNSGLAGVGFFDYGFKNFALRGEFGYRQNNNVKIPSGELENTNSKNLNSSFGVAYYTKSFSSGFAFRNYTGDYGIPTRSDHEDMPRFKIRRDKYEFKTDLKFEDKIIQGTELHLNQTNYDHREIEGGETATHIKIKTTNADIKLKHSRIGKFDGMLGANFLYQSYSTIGEEKFFADANLYLTSLVLYEEIGLGNLTLQTGLRFDYARVRSKEFESIQAQDKKFGVFSSSAGVVYKFSDPVSVSLSFARGFRVPSLQELFAYGPHLGTQSFEIGNPDLKPETSNELDLSLKLLTERSTADISLFLNYVNDFIYPFNTGEIDTGSNLPIYAYRSANAILRGFEAKFETQLFKNLNASLLLDYVEGKQRDVNEYLPFIPPFRSIASVEYRTSKFNFGVEVKAVSSQNKIAPTETHTPGYVIFNLHLGLRLPMKGLAQEINLNVENLTNRRYYDHLSRIKDFAPMPGRNISVIYHIFF